MKIFFKRVIEHPLLGWQNIRAHELMEYDGIFSDISKKF